MRADISPDDSHGSSPTEIVLGTLSKFADLAPDGELRNPFPGCEDYPDVSTQVALAAAGRVMLGMNGSMGISVCGPWLMISTRLSSERPAP